MHPKAILREIDLDSSQIWDKSLYYPNKTKKNLVTIHHTVGYSAQSSFDYLHTRAQRAARYNRTHSRSKGLIGVAFYIDKSGTVIQAFPSSAWAYNLGLNVRNPAEIESRNIGIELDNLGPLTKRGPGFYDAYGRKFSGEVYTVPGGQEWRGYKHYAAFTLEQVRSLSLLLQYLVQTHDIPREFQKNFFPIQPLPKSKFKAVTGIVSHSHFRWPRDKQDVSIALSPYMDSLRDEVRKCAGTDF